MEVWASGTPGVANMSDDLTSFHSVTSPNKVFLHMGKGSGVAITMINHHILSVASVTKRFFDDSIRGGANLLAPFASEVNAGMESGLSVEGVFSFSVTGSYSTRHRSTEGEDLDSFEISIRTVD